MEIKRPDQLSESFPQEEYAKEAEIRFDQKTVQESQRRYKSWDKEKLNKLQEEAKRILTKISLLMEKPIENNEVQALVREYHAYMENYYHVTSEIFMGLGELYMIDDKFTVYFEKIKTGLAEYLSRAMQHYCNTEFKEIKQLS